MGMKGGAATIDMSGANAAFGNAINEINRLYPQAVNEYNLASAEQFRTLTQAGVDLGQAALPFSQTAKDSLNELRQYLGMAPVSQSAGLADDLKSAYTGLTSSDFILGSGLSQQSQNWAGSNPISQAYGTELSQLQSIQRRMDSAESLTDPAERVAAREAIVNDLNSLADAFTSKHFVADLEASGRYTPAEAAPGEMKIYSTKTTEGGTIGRKLEEANVLVQNTAKNLRDYATDYANKYTDSGPQALSSQEISDRLTQTPEYQFAFEQGNQALQRSQSARGVLNSGNAAVEATQFGQNLANNVYQGHLQRLAQLSGMTLPTANQNISSIQNQGGLLSQAYQAAGAQRSGLLSSQAGQLAGVYSAQGNAATNAAVAQAQMQTQANMASGAGFGQLLGTVLGGII